MRASQERLHDHASENGWLQVRRFVVTDQPRCWCCASAALDWLDQRLAAPKASGVMKFINSEYRRRRLAAREAGKCFMPYRAAELRLRGALVAVATGDPPGLITRVFGPQ